MSTHPEPTVGAVDELIRNLRSPEDAVNGPAWQGADACGAAAIAPLAGLLTDPDFELARRAKHALYRIVRHSTRPGAAREARAVEAALIPLLQVPSAVTRRAVLWMLSEVGSNRSIAPMAALLTDKDAAEDARCALTRLPGKKAVAALRRAFASASEEFRYALADSLRQRGETVTSYPTRKRIPAKATEVKPVTPKPQAK